MRSNLQNFLSPIFRDWGKVGMIYKSKFTKCHSLGGGGGQGGIVSYCPRIDVQTPHRENKSLCSEEMVQLKINGQLQICLFLSHNLF